MIAWLRRRGLEIELTRILNTMDGHKEAGRLPGDRFYQLLWKQAQDAIAEYCRITGTNSEDIFTNVPRLKDLEDMCNTDHVNKPALITVISIGVIASIPIIAGISHDIYVLITRLVH